MCSGGRGELGEPKVTTQQQKDHILCLNRHTLGLVFDTEWPG